MKHFFERLEREIDFSKEYRKLEEMVCVENYSSMAYVHYSINDWIEENFRDWNDRHNYISFSEVREQVGFPFRVSEDRGYSFRRDVGMEDYFLYIEMILNLLMGLNECKMSPKMEEGTEHIIKTGIATVEKAGFEIKEIDSEYMIVEKNAVAVEVADLVPELAEVIIEYNHYLLRGDMIRKQELLKKIADALEPKRATLNSINKSATDDFFWMVNKMNVRHNNCDHTDKKNYFPEFAKLSSPEKEQWYDRIYDQSLMLFVLLEYQSRNGDIQAFKKSTEN